MSSTSYSQHHFDTQYDAQTSLPDSLDAETHARDSADHPIPRDIEIDVEEERGDTGATDTGSTTLRPAPRGRPRKSGGNGGNPLEAETLNIRDNWLDMYIANGRRQRQWLSQTVTILASSCKKADIEQALDQGATDRVTAADQRTPTSGEPVERGKQSQLSCSEFLATWVTAFQRTFDATNDPRRETLARVICERTVDVYEATRSEKAGEKIAGRRIRLGRSATSRRQLPLSSALQEAAPEERGEDTPQASVESTQPATHTFSSRPEHEGRGFLSTSVGSPSSHQQVTVPSSGLAAHGTTGYQYMSPFPGHGGARNYEQPATHLIDGQQQQSAYAIHPYPLQQAESHSMQHEAYLDTYMGSAQGYQPHLATQSSFGGQMHIRPPASQTRPSDTRHYEYSMPDNATFRDHARYGEVQQQIGSQMFPPTSDQEMSHTYSTGNENRLDRFEPHTAEALLATDPREFGAIAQRPSLHMGSATSDERSAASPRSLEGPARYDNLALQKLDHKAFV
ncbi:hypothetical protein IAU59_006300 [Kwoniella sp. CBS 9459]